MTPTDKRATASRANGKLGGRPKKDPETKITKVQLYVLPDVARHIKAIGSKAIEQLIRRSKDFRQN